MNEIRSGIMYAALSMQTIIDTLRKLPPRLQQTCIMESCTLSCLIERDTPPPTHTNWRPRSLINKYRTSPYLKVNAKGLLYVETLRYPERKIAFYN